MIKKLRENNSQAQPKKENKPAPVIKADILDLPNPEDISQYENEDGEVINDFEEENEEEQEKPQKRASQMAQDNVKKPDVNDDSRKIAEILRDLQDNGIYRLRILAQLEQLNKSFSSIDNNIKSLCDYLALKNG